jgi:hypothetical protein
MKSGIFLFLTIIMCCVVMSAGLAFVLDLTDGRTASMIALSSMGGVVLFLFIALQIHKRELRKYYEDTYGKN